MSNGLIKLRNQEPARGLPTAVRLHKGESKEAHKERGGKGRPAELPYFRAELQPGFVQYQALWDRLYGTEPTQIDYVYIPSDTPEGAFSTRMELYGSNNLIKLACDGQTCFKHFEPTTGRIETDPIPCLNEAKDESEKPTCGCTQVGRLNFVLPQFMRDAGTPMLCLLTTHGWTDIYQISGILQAVYALSGSCRGTWFSLVRVPTKEEYSEWSDKEQKYVRKTATKNHVQLRVMDQGLAASIALPEGAATPNALPVISSAAQLSDGKEHPFAVKAAAEAFLADMRQEFPTMTAKHIAEALQIAKWSDYTGAVQDAARFVRAWATGEATSSDYEEMPD